MLQTYSRKNFKKKINKQNDGNFDLKKKQKPIFIKVKKILIVCANHT